MAFMDLLTYILNIQNHILYTNMCNMKKYYVHINIMYLWIWILKVYTLKM